MEIVSQGNIPLGEFGDNCTCMSRAARSGGTKALIASLGSWRAGSPACHGIAEFPREAAPPAGMISPPGGPLLGPVSPRTDS